MVFDIVVVTFFEEFRLQKLQAISLDRFLDPSMVGVITVILNHWSSETEKYKIFKNKILPFYGRHLDKVNLVFADDYINMKNEVLGWRSQQLIKLMATRRSTADFVLILDSKNHLVSNITMDNLFDVSSGRPWVNLEKRSVMDKYLIPCIDQMGIVDFNSDVIFGCVTPFQVSAALVNDLILYCEAGTGISFESLFLTKNRMLTEFFLIYAYVLKTNSIEKYYSTRSTNASLTFFTTWPDSPERKKFAFRKMRDVNLVWFGLHRNRIGVLTSEELEEISDLWIRCGLFDSHGAISSFLNSDPRFE